MHYFFTVTKYEKLFRLNYQKMGEELISEKKMYESAKEMLLVDDFDNKEYLTGLFITIYDELHAPKPKKKK